MATIECVINNSHVTFNNTCTNTNNNVINLNENSTLQTINLDKNELLKENKLKRNSSNSKSVTKTKKKPYDEKLLIKYITNHLPDLDSLLTIKHKIGEGTFSSVFLAYLKKAPAMQFAVKHLIPMSTPLRMETELRCMQEIGGQDNVVSCTACFRNKDCVVFVMPYIAHRKFFDYVENMDSEETRVYMKNLLLALRRVHSFNVIHRDIKPSNFLYDRQNKKFLLVDFGLSQYIKTDSPIKTPQNTSLITNNKRKRVDDPTYSCENRSKRMALAPRIDDSNLIKPSPNKLSDINKTEIFNSKPIPIYKNDTENNTETVFSPPQARNIKKRLVFTETTTTPNSPNSTNKVPPKNISKSIVPPSHSFQKLTPGTNSNGNRTHMRLQNGQVQITFTAPSTAKPFSAKIGCKCFGLPQVCKVCLSNIQDQNAPRAGTPGFRPPEVLLKCRNQTTAVDIWAAGVILLSILSGRYPFFRAPDDSTALAEIITLFGFKAFRNAGVKMGRFVQSSNKAKAPDLRKVCQRLRERSETKKEQCKECLQKRLVKDGSCICRTPKMEEENILFSSYVEGDRFPDSAFDLLTRLMEIDPAKRITAEEALQHPFILNQ